MKTLIVDHRYIGARATAVKRASLQVDEIGPWLGRALVEIRRLLDNTGDGVAGAPFARFNHRDDGRVDVEAGFPVRSHITSAGDVLASRLPSGPVAVTTHVGPFDDMESAYGAVQAWIESRGGTPRGDPWEVYLSDPSDPPETWRTEIVQPFSAG